MTTPIRFDFTRYDFSRYDYTPSLEGIQRTPKAARQGRTRETTDRLFGCYKELVKEPAKEPNSSLVQLAQLHAFSHQLQEYIKSSLKRRYGIFAHLFLLFGCGPLGPLQRVQRAFDSLYKSSFERNSFEKSGEELQQTIKGHQTSERQRACDLEEVKNYFGAHPHNLLPHTLKERLLEMIPAKLHEERFVRALPHILATIFRSEPSCSFLEALALRAYGNRNWHEPLSRLAMRYSTLSEAGKRCHVAPDSLVKLAYFLEVHPVATSRTYTKKEPQWARYLPFSLHYDEANSTHYIALKRKCALLFRLGGTNKVTAAIQTKQNMQATTCAQATTRDTCQDLVKNAMRGAILQQKFKAHAGVWPSYFYAQHLKETQEGHIEKVSQFLALAEGDFLSRGTSLSFKELLDTSKQLLLGLQALYSQGYVHADIKGGNCLISHSDKSLRAGWTDFECAFRPESEPPTHSFHEGLYGTVLCTPPEVFGIADFTTTLEGFSQADRWALGLMLFRAYFRREPSWHSIVKEAKVSTVSSQMRQAFKTKVKEEVEASWTKLSALALQRTPEQEFELFIYSLLRLAPEKRISLEDALSVIERILL